MGFGRGATSQPRKKYYCQETSKTGSQVQPRNVKAAEEEEEEEERHLET